MFKKTITYTNYNGEQVTEDFYFNLSKAEIINMQLSEAGGFTGRIEKAIKAKDVPAVIAIFNDLIIKSYGEKSNDGKRFIKSKEISDAFMQTEAYSVLYEELITNDKAAQDFINNVCPPLTAEQKKAAEEEIAKLSIN